MPPSIRESVYQIGLKTTAFEAGLKRIRDGLTAIQSDLTKKTLTVKIEATQFDQLQKSIKAMATTLESAMKSSEKVINQSLIGINQSIVKSAEKSGDEFSTILSNSLKAGLRAAGEGARQEVLSKIDDVAKGTESRLENSAKAIVTRWHTEFAKLPDMAQEEFNRLASQANQTFGRVHDAMFVDKSGDQNIDRAKLALFNQFIALSKQFAKTEEETAKRRIAADNEAYDKAVAHQKQASNSKKEEEDALRRGNAALQDQLNTHKGIGVQLLENIARIVKWYVIIRTVQEVIQTISGAFRDMISSGIEYQKGSETQKLALEGVLAENFKILDSQGKQITGAAALSMLQTEAANQWRQIQGASLSVVGTTQDLMVLYSGILPFASRLGRGLEDIQKMTKGAAVAASLMGISFQDARSALIALLQGRVLGRNRLAGVMGLSKDDLKDEATRFDKINSKLDEFAAMGAAAAKTLAASAESAKEFVAMLGAAFVSPATDAFVTTVQNVTKALFNFDQTTNDFRPNQEFQNFLTLVSRAAADLIAPLQKLSQELIQQAGKNAGDWVVGMTNMLKPLVSMIEWLARASVAIVNFSAANGTMIKGLAILAGVLTGYNAWRLFIAYLNEGIAAGGALTKTFSILKVEQQALTTATELGAKATVSWGRAIQLTWSSTVIGVATAAIVYMVSVLIDWYNAAQNAIDVANKIKGKDFSGATFSNKKVWDEDALKGAAKDTEILTGRFQEFATNQLDTVDKIKEKWKGWRSETEKLSDRLEVLNKKKGKLSDADQNEKLDLVSKIQAQTDIREDYAQQRRNFQSDATSAVKHIQDEITTRQAELDRIQAKHAEISRAMGNDGDVGPDQSSRSKKLRAENAALGDQLGLQQKLLAQFGPLEKEARAQEALKTEPLPEPTEAKLQRPTYVDTFNEAVSAKKALNARLAEEDKLAVALGNKTRQEALKDEIARQKQLSDLIVAESQKRYRDMVETEAKIKAFDKQHPDKTFDPRVIEKQTADFRRDRDNALQDAAREEAHAKLVVLEQSKEIDAALAQAANEIHKKQEEVAFAVGETVAAQWAKRITQLQKMAKEAAAQSPEQGAKAEQLVRQAIALSEKVGATANIEQAIKNDNRTIANYQAAQKSLSSQFDKNGISAVEYAKRIVDLREKEKAAIQVAIEHEAALQAMAETNAAALGQEVSQDFMDASNARLDALYEKQAAIITQAQLLSEIYQKWVGLLGSAGDLLGDFGGFNDSKMKKGLDLIKDMVKAAQDFKKVLEEVNKFRDVFNEWAATAKKIAESSVKAAAKGTQTIGVAADGWQGTGEVGYGEFDTDYVTGAVTSVAEHVAEGSADAAGGAAGKVGKGLGMIPVYGQIAAAIIVVAVKAYQAAVKRALDEMEKGLNAVADQLSDGSMQIGEARVTLEQQRADMVKKYEGSKSGRNALMQDLPKYDTAIQDIKKQQTEASKSMKERLEDLRLGTGAIADFGKTLLDLKRDSQEYIGKFAPDTKEYIQALKDVAELYALSLTAARQKLEDQMSGFEDEAITAAQNVISLMDERQQLFESLANEQEQLQDLADSRSQLAEDKAKAAVELEKERADHAKEILDTEKEIADTIAQAADDERKIRQEGVVEAQQTVAMRKATDISKIRSDARDSLDKLGNTLEELRASTELDEKVKDTNESFEKRTKELDKQELNLRKQIAATQTQIGLNEIHLGTATTIRNMSGEVFNVSGDIFDLERRRGQLEIDNAAKRIQNWKDVKGIIDAIAAQSLGIGFVPPDNYPAIHVSVEGITIDNSSNDTNDFSDRRSTTTGVREVSDLGPDYDGLPDWIKRLIQKGIDEQNLLHPELLGTDRQGLTS